MRSMKLKCDLWPLLVTGFSSAKYLQWQMSKHWSDEVDTKGWAQKIYWEVDWFLHNAARSCKTWWIRGCPTLNSFNQFHMLLFGVLSQKNNATSMNSLNIVHLGMKVLTPPLVVIQTRIETKQSSSLLDKFFWGVKTFIPKCSMTINLLRDGHAHLIWKPCLIEVRPPTNRKLFSPLLHF